MRLLPAVVALFVVAAAALPWAAAPRPAFAGPARRHAGQRASAAAAPHRGAPRPAARKRPYAAGAAPRRGPQQPAAWTKPATWATAAAALPVLVPALLRHPPYLLLLLYFAPTLAGWLRARAAPGRGFSPWGVFAVNLLAGWTGVGWLLAWPLALGRRRAGGGVPAAAATGPYRQPEWLGPPIWGDEPSPPRESPAPREGWQEPARQPTAFPPSNQGWQEPAAKPPCEVCHDQGMTCPKCLGSRGEWVRPQTENGASYWEPCSRCLGSGKVQCTACGKTGW